jgi:hypothetical protein
MRLFFLFILLSISSLSFSQDKSILDEIPYKSVTKEILKEEQIFYYEDEYRIYFYFKPTLVSVAIVTLYIKGIPIRRQMVRISKYNNRFEIKKQNIEGTIVIFIKDANYIIQIKKKGNFN